MYAVCVCDDVCCCVVSLDNSNSQADAEWKDSDTCTLYVATNGNDSNPGTSPSTAKKTVQAAVEASRKLKGDKTICVGAGTFRLASTIELTSADSHLTISGTYVPTSVRMNAPPDTIQPGRMS